MCSSDLGGGGGPGDVKSGLWLADYVGAMMSEGAGGTFYFHYMPTPGRISNFLILDSNYRVVAYPPQYLAAQVITREWVQPTDAPHQLFRASSDVIDESGNVLVTAYAVKRPDRLWSLMLINKDHDHDHMVSINFADDESSGVRHFEGKVDELSFGPGQYQWHADLNGGHADPDGPALKSTLQGSAGTTYNLPKASIIILRGNLSE